MNPQDFKRILVSFADNTKDIALDRNEILIQIRDEIMQINIHQEATELIITENNTNYPAMSWITTRLAKLPQLADRILEFIKPEEFFICPNGSLVDDLRNDPSEVEKTIENISSELFRLVDNKEPFASKVIYITSDAGEGKSTIINELAREQARKYKNKQTNWLLLPVQLGGGPFMRLDDLIIASLVNRYRFPNFYFDSLIELIKEGVIVLALDGFEEMFMQSDEGEALSSLGQIMNKLDSRGTVMIAARKAYFDYKNLSVQARLFDSLKINNIYFSRLQIQRWGKNQFLSYASKREFHNTGLLYDELVKLLGENNSLLTRAVLVRQLFEIFKTDEEIIELSTKLSTLEIESHFSSFVDSIISREANQKWINRSIDPAQALIPASDHKELLSILAQEMWLDNRDLINLEMLEFLLEFFSTNKKYSAEIFRQIKERIKQHALIVNSQMAPNSFSFDHEEFKNYFLGIAIANKLMSSNASNDNVLIKILRNSSLPYRALMSVIVKLKECNIDISTLIVLYSELVKNESQMSFLRENFSIILLKYISVNKLTGVLLSNLVLPLDSLININLNEIQFVNSSFQNTGVSHSQITKCIFENCAFDRLEIPNENQIAESKLIDCSVNCIYDLNEEHSYFDPQMIKNKLKTYGFQIIENKTVDIEAKVETQIDGNILFIEKLIRCYTRSTYLSESVLKIKFGRRYSEFEDDLLPILIKNDILERLVDASVGYRLKKSMSNITDALQSSNGSFEQLLKALS